MQQRPPPPRWSPPVPQAQWMPPRPAFVPPFPPPARGVLGAPRFYPPPPRPPRGYFPRFVPPPRPPPPRPPVADPEQIWLEGFRQTHCNSVDTKKADVDGVDEPPLRLLRRRVARAQKLAEQLKVAAAELAGVEKRLVSLSTDYEEGRRAGTSLDAASNVEVARLRVQRERKLAVCQSLKKELEAMNASSGLFSEQQLAVIRPFAARVNKKKVRSHRARFPQIDVLTLWKLTDAGVVVCRFIESELSSSAVLKQASVELWARARARTTARYWTTKASKCLILL